MTRASTKTAAVESIPETEEREWKKTPSQTRPTYLKTQS